jgi:uncharacterized protein YecE (DUF72 family)
VDSGRLLVGTSGFAYREWAPLFYPAGVRAADLLREYSARLPAAELNNTFYRQPRPEAISGWLEQTPVDFRFVAKAQRGGSWRAFGGAGSSSAEPVAETVEWLTAPYRLFGERLGCVLLRVPDSAQRDDARLAALLEAWPGDLPLTLDLADASWQRDEVFALLAEHGAALCATDADDLPMPDLRLTGSHLYLRLRRASYSASELSAWAGRLRPFLEDGIDCYVFFRHDERGESALRALELNRLAGRGATPATS